jgi:hypothetical protein
LILFALETVTFHVWCVLVALTIRVAFTDLIERHDLTIIWPYLGWVDLGGVMVSFGAIEGLIFVTTTPIAVAVVSVLSLAIVRRRRCAFRHVLRLCASDLPHERRTPNTARQPVMLISNSAGLTYPSAEWIRLRL